MLKKSIQNILRNFGYELRRFDKRQGNLEVSIANDQYSVGFVRAFIEGNHYFVPKYAMHRPGVKSLLGGQFSEPRTHRFVELVCSKQSGSIIHAGTFFGDMLPNFSRFTSGTVYAFEPVLENYLLAKLSIEKNQLSNVILLNSALSVGITNLRINTMQGAGLHAGGGSTIQDDGQICSSLNIDCLNAKDILLIQLDVEGHELMALRGAVETITKCRPIIAIEDNGKNCDAFLKELKYELIKKIPGLDIWVPEEKQDLRKLVKQFC